MPSATRKYRLDVKLVLRLMAEASGRAGEDPWTPREIAEEMKLMGLAVCTRSVQTWIDGSGVQPAGPKLVALAEILGVTSEKLIE